MRRKLILAVAASAASFHLFAAGVSPFTALVQRPVHLALMATLGFLGVGMRTSSRRRKPDIETGESDAGRPRSLLASAPLIGTMLLGCAYLVSQHEALVRRVGAPTTLDMIAGAAVIVAVLELARRTSGWGLVSVAIVAIAYAFAGPSLPGVLAHRGYSVTRLVEHFYLSTEGIWGIPLGVSADFVYLFVLFGAVLDAAGGGELLIGLASKLAGKTRGGPAKTAAVASALMGSLSGSAVANVVTTGTLTIPLMLRSGIPRRLAAAIEAAASTGGQLMPPVMGAGAFILATWTNIPYIRVATAALIPAVLYYVALYMAIHFSAPAPRPGAWAEDDGRSLLDRIHLLVPLIVIVVFLALGRSPMRAAFWGAISVAIAATARGSTRMDGARWERALVAGASGTVQVAAACATAGIVVGVASLTGIGLRMSGLIVTVANGQLPVALVLTAVGSIVLGMGLPTTAAYVVLAALGAPALTELGVPLLAAHLFIFYFGCLSNVTPPVALAAYAAAGIGGSSPLRTGVTAMSLAATGFIVPFVFVYGPSLLMEGPAAIVAVAALSAAAGVTSLAAAIVGRAGTPLRGWARLTLIVAALALLRPGIISDVTGLALATVAFTAGRGKGRKVLQTQ